eukprot:Unigene2758_Nuclearia_a/m.8537 Unigene2758_Nuclearia_a/g.8537  ORF Unigene2758_Nuclearia_a/g.8537 Unigene2758_Nuclearia_a/m.8537 type:complete len:137 (+) Unigene2758_Nuclearia_a:3358-3768(+)
MNNPADILKLLNTTFTKSQFYGCDYYEVKQINDMSIPEHVTLGINAMNVFVIDTTKKTVIHKYRYGDVISWSSSEDRVSIKFGSMVGGLRFIAETYHGGEICHLLDLYSRQLAKQNKRSAFMSVPDARQAMLAGDQ